MVRVPLDMCVQERYIGEVLSSPRLEKCEAKAKQSRFQGRGDLAE